MAQQTIEETADAVRRARPWVAESVGALVALAVSLVVVAWVAATSDTLMFTDGDSVIVAMLARSVALGQPQDWAMSPVLFLPEAALYGLLALLGLGIRATLTLNAVVNLLLLYGAIRIVAGRRRAGRAPVLAAVCAFAAFAVLVLLEGSAALAGLQLATLLATTTYYSLTVVAAVAVIGLVRRLIDGAAPVPTALAIGLVAAVSVLTNPLFAVWAAAPVVLVLVAMMLAWRIPRRPALLAAGGVAAGCVIGYLGRVPFSASIVAADGNYVRLDRWTLARDHFGTAFAATLTTWHGMLWVLLLAGLTTACVVVAVRAWRRGDAVRAFVASVAVLSPLATTVGTIAIGTDADRYLQPWVFLPILVLAIVPPRLVVRRSTTLVAGVLAVAVAAAAIPVVTTAATRDDADLDCVVDWVDRTDRIGAGQFWTVRAPKAHLDDPTQLVQVDHTLRVYEWLTNRVDTAAGDVSFLVQDAATSAFVLPDGIDLADAQQVACGRYTIYDFAPRQLALGPPRS